MGISQSYTYTVIRGTVYRINLLTSVLKTKTQTTNVFEMENITETYNIMV